MEEPGNSITPVPAKVGPPDRGRPVALAALFIVGAAAFANLYAPQPLLPRLRETFRASELMVSLTISAAVFGVSLSAPLIGWFSDRAGRKRVIVASLIGLGFATALSGAATGLDQLIASRFVQGCFVPGIIASTMAYIVEETPARSVGVTMATYVTGTVIGGFSGRLITGLIVARWDWHLSFVVLGAVTLLGALATWRFLPRSTKFVRQRNAAGVFGSMRSHLLNRELLATYAVGFQVLFCLVGSFTYVNFYLADKPFFLGPAFLASIFGVYLVGAVITPVAGRIMDSIGHRRALMGAVGMSAIGMSLTLIHCVPVIVAGLALESSGVFACQSASSSHVGKAALEAKSLAAGLYVSFYYFGGFAGSVVPGILWTRAGWPGCVAIILCIQCLTIFIAKKFWRD